MQWTILSLILGQVLAAQYGSAVCPQNWLSSTVPNKCLRLMTRRQNEPRATELCADFGGALASIESEEEDKLVVQNFVPLVDTYLLFGGVKDKNTNIWYWKAGVPFFYRNWSAAETFEPARDLTYYYSHSDHKNTPLYGKWHAGTDHTSPYPYICELRIPVAEKKCLNSGSTCGCSTGTISVPANKYLAS